MFTMLKLSVVRPRRIRPLLLITLLAWFPLIPMANAESIELLPSISLHIGEQDNSGNYWDGYDWRDRQWWHDHQGRDLGERNRHGHYWDGYRWQNRDWWKKTITIAKGAIGNMTSIMISMVKNTIAAKATVIIMTTK